MDWQRPDPEPPEEERPELTEAEKQAAEERQLANRQRVSLKMALISLTASPAWETIRGMANQAIYELEQKAIQEDDEAKGRTYRADARGARKFWETWLRNIGFAQCVDDNTEDFRLM
jgi:hypothetical protein